MDAAELDALLSEGEARSLSIEANQDAIQRLHAKFDAHPCRLLRNYRLLREARALLEANRRMLDLNDALLARLRLAMASGNGKARS